MNKKIKVIAFVIIVIIIGFFSARYYAYHGGKRDIQSEEAAFTASSKAIVQEFTINTEVANKKYLEKPVAISGTVTSVEGKQVIIDEVVNCDFLAPNSTITKGQNVIVKGRVVGFDDLLGELKLDQCNLSTK